MKKINTLVVGQGIAGSLVAYMLHQRAIPFAVIDPGHTNTASRIAAGMFTPISGKRKTISAATLQQIPFAIKIYREIEALLDIHVLHLQHIYHVFATATERNEIQGKLENQDFAKYIVQPVNEVQGIHQSLGAYEIINSGWVDCGLLVNAFTRWLQQKEALVTAAFVHADLTISNGKMGYRGMEFEKIIFCEGYRSTSNPFFLSANIVPCKGDILTIRCDGFATDRIIKRDKVYLIHEGDDLFRAGATYQWANHDEEPSEAGRKMLEDQLDELLLNKYTTVGHQAGIRPTTQNREVIAQEHPDHKGMFMLNGLGTKGILQGPRWAKYIVESLL